MNTMSRISRSRLCLGRRSPSTLGVLPHAVVAPYRHVSAKLPLCSLDETYYAGLSDASKRSFAVQGGELSRSEAMRLLALEGMDDAMALRRWDDRAKVHGVEVPNLDAYGQVVLDHLV